MSEHGPSLAGIALRPYWFDTVPPEPARPALAGDLRVDLAIVGGGFTGLWTALQARKRDPQARIALVEAGRTGNAASGRNGGFCAPSISHGVGNALRRWPREAETLVRLGRENLDGFAQDVAAHGLAIEFERAGKLTLAATPWQVEGLNAMAANYRRFGIAGERLSGDALAAKLDSPVYRAGFFEPNYALVNPAKTVAELRRVVLSLGVDIHEQTPVTALRHTGSGIELVTPGGVMHAARAVLATNAAVPLLARLKPAVIPIYDYAIMTRPLDADELAAIGWTGRHSVADSGNQFHYIRKTADNRILWGGYDAVYHFGSRRDAALLDRAESYDRLARHFRRALPPLAHVPFTHAWGGIIDTSARTTFFAGLAFGGRLAYAMGFTGQGVSASRFAARTMLDLLAGEETERTRLAMLRRRPFPFPPEPLRWLGISWAQAGLASEDRTGRRSRFNRLLDAFGVGFDS
ncbi:NAD(P)/FAD-dependent oxidoreductase [Ancylobacter amanitiformis]|uniref:Glycine/D-amino acid oxidase-like deaminating enzyme n=1 Tax=Ancylobacter amanitiformis TaxID=217069 RepID=A0ABU0LKF0_9HYPH|nr:FAD-dependent oxidoreductase [Ancylobacter amanitiformis]MDQ0509168.1 glycine/D-amino acid oxidase-like deaminating enzyme [Ancylobacter amanitiformis]